MDIDPELEENLVLGVANEQEPIDLSEGGVPTALEWLAEVRANREAAEEVGIRTIISSRAAMYGARMATLGVGKDWLREMLIYKGMNELDREKLRDRAKTHIPRAIKKLSTLSSGEREDEREKKYEFIEPNDELEINPSTTLYSENLGNSLRQYLKYLVEKERGNTVDLSRYREFVTSLTWTLEKEVGICPQGSDDYSFDPIYDAWNKNENAKTMSIRTFVNNQRDFLGRKNLYTADNWYKTRPNGYTFTFMGALSLDASPEESEELIASFEDVSFDEMSAIRDAFKADRGFSPGPLSLSYWMTQKGYKNKDALLADIDYDA